MPSSSGLRAPIDRLTFCGLRRGRSTNSEKEENHMSVAAQFVNPQSVSSSTAKHQSHTAMNVTLWVAQLLGGVFFSITGFGKLLCFNPALWNQALHEVSWFSAVPQNLFIFIGV